MKLRWFLLLVPALSFLNCKQENQEPQNSQRPNIIWLVAEDQSPEFFPFYGNKSIELPSLEELAQEAVIFKRAYAPVPVCAPTRSSIITGLYPTSLGTHNMRTYNAYNPENESDIGIPSYSPIPPENVRVFTEYLRREGYYCTNNAKEDYNFKKPSHCWDDSGDQAHWRNRQGNSPFFSVFNFGVCHESGVWKYQDSTLYVDEKTLEIPPYFPDTDVVRHDMAVNYSNLKRLDNSIGKIVEQLKEDGLYDNSYIFFYSDHGGPFPRHKRSLHETGIRVPFLIKAPKNSGGNEHSEELVSFIDLAPTVLSLAGIKPPKVMQGKALLGEFAKRKIRKHLFATSDRFDEIRDKKRAVVSSRWKYIRNYYPELPDALPISYREQMPMMSEMRELYENNELDEDQQKWFSSPQTQEELYDLENDPYELNNIANMEVWNDTLLYYRQLLDQWILSSGDLGVFPEEELMNLWLPAGKQPQLSKPEITIEDDKLMLSSFEDRASIIWQNKTDHVWRIYKEPVALDQFYRAKTTAIGFEESEEVQLEN